VFNVREYGAAGDGKTLDTAAINKAVEKCAQAGGGQVRFGPGRYLSGFRDTLERV
jgi:polygalacturonase